MNIVLIGIQGSGKGTLVAGLGQHVDFTLISMGQLLRDEIATGSKLGQEIKQIIDKGDLVDLDISMSILKKKLAHDTNEIRVFDGFPRCLEQAKALEKIMKVDLVIHLHISKEVAINRLLNRLTCSKCGYITTKSAVSSLVCPKCSGELRTRDDDCLESIEKRFKVFEQDTYPLLDIYRKQGARVETIDAQGNTTDTLNSVLKVLNEYNY